MKKYLIVLLVFVAACNLFSPTKDEIAHLYVDILVAEEEYKSDTDSMKIVVNKLYKNYDITEEDYRTELEKYKYDEETWAEFFVYAENYLDTLKSQEKKFDKK